jgi:hypothetical protein
MYVYMVHLIILLTSRKNYEKFFIIFCYIYMCVCVCVCVYFTYTCQFEITHHILEWLYYTRSQ